MTDLLSLTIDELKQFAVGIGEKPFRGKQIFIWLNRGVFDFDEMTDLSKGFRSKLNAGLENGSFTIGECRVAEVQEDKHDGTKKFLFELEADVTMTTELNGNKKSFVESPARGALTT